MMAADMKRRKLLGILALFESCWREIASAQIAPINSIAAKILVPPLGSGELRRIISERN